MRSCPDIGQYQSNIFDSITLRSSSVALKSSAALPFDPHLTHHFPVCITSHVLPQCTFVAFCHPSVPCVLCHRRLRVWCERLWLRLLPDRSFNKAQQQHLNPTCPNSSSGKSPSVQDSCSSRVCRLTDCQPVALLGTPTTPLSVPSSKNLAKWRKP